MVPMVMALKCGIVKTKKAPDRLRTREEYLWKK